MSWDLVILVMSIFAFIISMIATLRCFFYTRSSWFLVLVACTLISGTCMAMELQRILSAPPSPDAPAYIRQPTTPL